MPELKSSLVTSELSQLEGAANQGSRIASKSRKEEKVPDH